MAIFQTCVLSMAMAMLCTVPVFGEIAPGTDDMTKGTTDWSNSESYVYNNNSGIPDEGLYLAASRSGGGEDGLLTVAEAQTMDMLNANNGYGSTDTKVKNLKGIDRLSNLEWVWLQYNEISSIEPLLALPAIRSLWVTGNPITDVDTMLSTIAKFTQIQQLDICGYQIDSLEKLKVCKNIQLLWVGQNNLDNQSLMKIVSWFQDLSSLRIEDNPEVTDIGVLSNASNTLKELQVGSREGNNTVLTNVLSTVLTLKHLQWFEANFVEIPDFTAFSKLTELQYIYVTQNKMKSLEGIENLANLKELVIHHNEVKDISKISQLVKLERLMANNNPLTQLPDLGSLKNLTLDNLSLNSTHLTAQELREKLPNYLKTNRDWESWLQANAADGAGGEFNPWPEDMARPPENAPGVPFVYQVSGDTYLQFDQEGPQVKAVTPKETVSNELMQAADKARIVIGRGFDISVVDENGNPLSGALPYTLIMKIYDRSIVPGRQYYVFLEPEEIGRTPVQIKATYIQPGLISFPVNHFSTYFIAYKDGSEFPSQTSESRGGGNYFSHFTITGLAGDGGKITPSGESVVDAGNTITYTVTPNDGYQVKRTLIDDQKEVSLVGNTYTFRNINEPYKIVVEFEKMETTETAASNSPEVSSPVVANPATGDDNSMAIVGMGCLLGLCGISSVMLRKIKHS